LVGVVSGFRFAAAFAGVDFGVTGRLPLRIGGQVVRSPGEDLPVGLLGRLGGLGLGPGEIGQKTESVHIAADGLLDHSADDFGAIEGDLVVDFAEESAGGFAVLEAGLVCRVGLRLTGAFRARFSAYRPWSCRLGPAFAAGFAAYCAGLSAGPCVCVCLLLLYGHLSAISGHRSTNFRDRR